VGKTSHKVKRNNLKNEKCQGGFKKTMAAGGGKGKVSKRGRSD